MHEYSLNIFTHAYIYTYIYIHIHAYVYIYKHVFIYSYICINIYCISYICINVYCICQKMLTYNEALTSKLKFTSSNQFQDSNLRELDLIHTCTYVRSSKLMKMSMHRNPYMHMHTSKVLNIILYEINKNCEPQDRN
jgi:hypothetical protein